MTLPIVRDGGSRPPRRQDRKRRRGAAWTLRPARLEEPGERSVAQHRRRLRDHECNRPAAALPTQTYRDPGIRHELAKREQRLRHTDHGGRQQRAIAVEHQRAANRSTCSAPPRGAIDNPA